ncbi:MAG: FAD-dependent oxidoreductase [Verrucomicrobia bacterium Tous-C9LFEB]|nr:MAG: FAD-dependent oxidoreductase [Verrucomicrobia bacterium Tous-C9LFEB]
MEANVTAGKEIVVLGAGFGGLTFCQKFASAGAHVTLIDRQNHHLFQPLLYQVATAGLSPAEIAQPVRSILSDKENVTVLLDEVLGFDLAKKEVALSHKTMRYDYLVIALGGVTSYFGHPEWEKFAPGLKSIDDALRIRREILLAFEHAELETDPERVKQLLTIVVVGGGPTGVELAGAFAELARHVLRSDFRHIDPSKARVVLVEAGPRILGHLPEDLSASAQRQLEDLGVEVRTSTRVTDIHAEGIQLGVEYIAAANKIWAAGVGASPLTAKLGVPLDRAGRIQVQPDLSVPGHAEVFAVGDVATIIDANGRVVPGVSPAAMQMAGHVAREIENELGGGEGIRARSPFVYWDKGTMATIGRSAAVAMIGPVKFSGFMAWLSWLFVHLIFLIGFKNKFTVIVQWAYSYFAYKRGARLITGLR